MNIFDFIDYQTIESRKLVKSLLNELPAGKWYETPAGINSNIAWQAGHLVISQYFNAIIVVKGSNKEIQENIPLRQYAIWFAMGSNPTELKEEFTPDVFNKHLDFVAAVAQKVLFSLSEDDLSRPLEPSKMPHPIAKNKLEALSWHFKHEIWHCGQIAMIRRAIGCPVNYFR
ncbi:MAG TPA: DinB family protein [Cyclobacteriaceae bacterium]|jgi:uncharacterized damage-inducible protein DinB